MRSIVATSLPPTARRSIAKLGEAIRHERTRRSLTINVMAGQMGVSTSTYQRIEKGDPSVTVGMYAMALACLGRDDAISGAFQSGKDPAGTRRRVQRRSGRASNSKLKTAP